MIESAEDFVALCESKQPDDIEKSLADEAKLDVWLEIVHHYKKYQIDVAQNRTIPPEIMRFLAYQGSETIRSILAEKRRLLPELFEVFANDSEPSIRQTIAANAKVPLAILQILTKDADEGVSRVARYNYNLRKIRRGGLSGAKLNDK